MALGTLALAWLLAAPLPADVTPMNTRDFKIPIEPKDPARWAEIKELLLYSSHDQGKTWGLEFRGDPSLRAFPFMAKEDGLYWFTICVVDRQGKQDPPDAAQGQVGVKVLVDTVRPVIRVSAERQGDGVAVSWDITEDNPSPSTLKLEYRTAEPVGQWVPVPVAEPGLKGQAVIPRAGQGPLTVRLQVQDVAGNHGVQQADVPAAAPAPPPPPPPPGGTTISFSSGGPAGTPVAGGSVAADRGDSWAPTGGGVVPVTSTGQPAVRSVDAVPAPGGGGPAPLGGPGGGGTFLATTGGAGPRPGPGEPQPQPPARLVRGSLPPLQVINSNRITLDYEVAKFGASGVGAVELYVTRNDGQTWERWAGEQPPPVPGAPDARGGASVRRSLTAELPGEGTYGFFLVVRSGVGRGKPPPKNGDPPQVRVEVDLTPPEARLYPLEPVQGRRDALLIRWTATDRNLGPTPILLEWSDRKDGQWQAIGSAEGLPNRGEYLWQVPPHVPAQVYFRLSVRDTAGNVGVAETSEKVTIDLNEPEVRVIGLTGSR